MKELTHIFVFIFLVVGTAMSQSENQFAKLEPNSQNVFESNTENSLSNF